MTLNHARLPIPPLRQRSRNTIEIFATLCNAKSRLASGMFRDSVLYSFTADADQYDAPGQVGGVL